MAQTIKLKRGTSANLGSLTLQAGEPAFCTDNGKLYIGNGTDKVLINPEQSNAITSVAGKTGAVTLAKGDVGLGNVDNTSDLNKPISTAVQTALDGKANSSHTHNYAGSSSAGGAATTALACTGNSATATKLATARTISLTGAVTGDGSFDGSGNLSITTTLAITIDGGTF